MNSLEFIIGNPSIHKIHPANPYNPKNPAQYIAVYPLILTFALLNLGMPAFFQIRVELTY